MDKIEMKIIGLSFSPTQEQSSYVLVLDSIDNEYKLPMIIGSREAEKIASTFENISSYRPSIYDVIKNLVDNYNLSVKEVFIHDILEGIFYTKLKASDGTNEISFDCSSGDAMVLSTMFDCPIYTTSDILKIGGVKVSNDGMIVTDTTITPPNDKSNLSIEELEEMLNGAIEEEEYELAAEIRDRINKLKK